MQQRTMFPVDDKPVFQRFLPHIEQTSREPETNIWNVPSTISQLGYLVHNHYRYYGKFPSVIAGQLLEQFEPPTRNDWVLDNFCGSGTTLVEAKLRGINSLGIDVSWLSILVSNVKIRSIDIGLLDKCLNTLLQSFQNTKREMPATIESRQQKFI